MAYDSKKAGHQKLGDGWGRLENELQKPLLQTPSPAVLRVGRGADLREIKGNGGGVLEDMGKRQEGRVSEELPTHFLKPRF